MYVRVLMQITLVGQTLAISMTFVMMIVIMQIGSDDTFQALSCPITLFS